MMLAVNDFSYIIHAKKKNLGQLNLNFFFIIVVSYFGGGGGVE